MDLLAREEHVDEVLERKTLLWQEVNGSSTRSRVVLDVVVSMRVSARASRS